MPPPNINLSDFPPEEQEYIAQLGKISRPFVKEPRDPYVKRAVAFFQSLVVAQVWEVEGCDVSAWQLDIDWSLLRQYAKFAFIRYGYGNDFRDPKAAQNARGAEDNKVIYDGYWYLKPDKSWSKMATSFYAAREEYGGQMYPDFDLEETGGLGKSALANWVYKGVTAYCALAKTTIDKTLLYSNRPFYESYVEPGILKPMELHLAQWTKYPTPTPPKDWAVKGVKIWQHWVAEKGEIPGVTTRLDLDRYMGTASQFETEFNVTLPPPAPPSVPTRVKVNRTEINVRYEPTDVRGEVSVVCTTKYGKIWKTTGVQFLDASGRGYWYQVSDDHGQVLWLAGWLVTPI